MPSGEWRPFCLDLNALSAGPSYVRGRNLISIVPMDDLITATS